MQRTGQWHGWSPAADLGVRQTPGPADTGARMATTGAHGASMLSHAALRGYYLLQVSLNLQRRRLRLLLSAAKPTGTRIEHSPTNLELVVEGVSNLSRVEAFFFGSKLPPVNERPDQVVDLRETKTGCSIELKHAGRVAIRTEHPPILENEDAGEQ